MSQRGAVSCGIYGDMAAMTFRPFLTQRLRRLQADEPSGVQAFQRERKRGRGGAAQLHPELGEQQEPTALIILSFIFSAEIPQSSKAKQAVNFEVNKKLVPSKSKLYLPMVSFP